MSLMPIFLMIAAALGAQWSHWGQRFRRVLLLIASLTAVFGLQTYATQAGWAIQIVLPILSILITVMVWQVVTPISASTDKRTAILVTGVTGILAVLFSVWTPSGDFLTILPSSIVQFIPLTVTISVAMLGLGTLLPAGVSVEGADKNTTTPRQRVALLFVVGLIIVLALTKSTAARLALAATAAHGNTVWRVDWLWLGFSYISFRLLHVLLDYRAGRYQPVALGDFITYVLFFPTLTAGPIERIERFTKQLQAPTPLTSERLLVGGWRIASGLFKKFALADNLAYFALTPTLAAQAHGGRWSFWFMVYAYALQLYFDFSGYTDIAIGIAHLAGITLPENFTAPYLKRNITAFWNSWHITLSTWFRNYFFTPFSRAMMNTRLKSHRFFMIFIAQVLTMILIGLWHGIALNFVLWGAWHGVGLWLHRVLQDRSRVWDQYTAERPILAKAIHWLSVLVTFHFVAIGWVFFALPNLDLILRVLRGLIGLPLQ